MIECMLAAPASGSGKTALVCALLAALQKRGLAPCAFKCGPDYIDPMFHRAVLGVASHNLDLFLCGEDAARALYARHAAGHGAAVTEGVMGFYDGVGGVTARASAWHVADTLGLPVLLVLRPRGASLTLAAQVRGLLAFRQPSHIAGILLNDCSPMLAQSLAPMLERETGVPVLGSLPHMPEAAFESRHLGLYTAAEIDGLAARIDALAAQLEQSVDMPRLLALCGGRATKLLRDAATGDGGEDAVSGNSGARTAPAHGETETAFLAERQTQSAPPGEAARTINKAAQLCGRDAVGRIPVLHAARIAVARDEAFCFVYAETLDALRDAGAELLFFSPVHDAALPAGTNGLYLPGGYPELYAGQLSQNASMRCAVRRAVEAGMPTVAECGGFLYLGQSLAGEDGAVHPMAGVLPGAGVRRQKLVRFGYAQLTAREDSLLLRAGETVPAHEFHYWDSTENGAAFAMQKPVTGRALECGFATPALYAAFPHLYFAGRPQLAARFVRAAAAFQIGL